MRALVLAQIPYPDRPRSIATDQLALIRMDNNIIHRRAVVVVALDSACAYVPDLDGAVLGARHHPLAFAVERDARHIGRVAFKGEDGTGIGRLDVVEFDRVVAGGGEIALVGRYAEAVYLGVGRGNCARADSG
jgi:hypothetical protein